MKRVRTHRRPDWQSIVETQGLVFGTPAVDASGADRVYWDESVYYEFEAAPNGEWVDLGIVMKPTGRDTEWDYSSGMKTKSIIGEG